MCNKSCNFLPPDSELPINPTARLSVGTILLLDTGKTVRILADESDFYIVQELDTPDSLKFGISVYNIKKVLE